MIHGVNMNHHKYNQNSCVIELCNINILLYINTHLIVYCHRTFSFFILQSLRLSRTSLDETTVGQVVNLLSNDVSRFDMAYKHFHFLWIGPLGTVVVTYFLWQEIGGVSSLLGVAGLLAFVPLQGICRIKIIMCVCVCVL